MDEAEERTVVAAGWWAGTIRLAVEEGDAELRAWLAEATGDPEAWTAFVPWAGKDGQAALGMYMLQLTGSLAEHGTVMPFPAGPGYDPLRARGEELVRRIIRGMLAGEPACQPR